MDKFRDILKLDKDTSSRKLLFIFLLIAYTFSVGIRYYWVGMFDGNPMSMWNGYLMINTNDGYAWAEGARDILAGGNTPHDQSAVTQPISIITAFLASVVPVSFETLILWMPVFLGSLLVIPVILIGRALGQTKMGFIAGMLVGIVWSYYNRTMAGYYDTDLLVIVLPAFVMWAIVLSLIHQKNRYLILTTAFIVIYKWYYGGSYSLLMAVSAILIIYTLLFDRKNMFYYKTALFILIALNFPTTISKIVTLTGLYGFFHFYKERSNKFVLPLLIAVGAYILYIGGFNGIIQKIDLYIVRAVVADDINLKFFSVVQTVREAGAIPFDVFANRISGSIPSFLLASIGTVGLMIRYPVMLVSIPMLGLGFMAYSSGLRFTVYAVPIMALGVAFLIMLISKNFKSLPIKIGFLVFATTAILYPNIKHIQEYMVPTVFNSEEVKVLDDLYKRAKREDYVITWWDYGFPIRYYANVKTLVDGGKHTGYQNFAPSLIISSPSQKVSAKMARLEVEYDEMSYTDKRTGYNIAKMMKDYGYQDPREFISSLNGDIKLPNKTRDIYLYLPNRMLNIFATVNLFSNMNILTGERYPGKYFSKVRAISDNQKELRFDNGTILDKTNSTIRVGGGIVGVKSFHIVEYDRSGNLRKKSQKLRQDGALNIIFMKSYNQFLIVDDDMLNSTFIQLFVFENYDKELFEPVTKSPYAKVYKLKI